MNGSPSSRPLLSSVRRISSLVRTSTHSPARAAISTSHLALNHHRLRPRFRVWMVSLRFETLAFAKGEVAIPKGVAPVSRLLMGHSELLRAVVYLIAR